MTRRAVRIGALVLGLTVAVATVAPAAHARTARVPAKSAHACTVLTQADLEQVTGQQVSERRRDHLEDGSTQCVWDVNGGVQRDDPTGGTLDVRAGRFRDAKAQLADARRESKRSAGKARAVADVGDAAVLAGRDTFSAIIARQGRAIVSIGSKLEVGPGPVAPPTGGYSEDEVERWLTELAVIALPRA